MARFLQLKKKPSPENWGVMHSLPKKNHPLNHLTNHWGVGLFKVYPWGVARTEQGFVDYLENGIDEILHWHMPVFGWAHACFIRWFFNLNFGIGCGFTSVPGFTDSAPGGVVLTGFKGGSGKEVRVEGLGKIFGFQWGQTGGLSTSGFCGDL